jgi:hypothetical protein
VILGTNQRADLITESTLLPIVATTVCRVQVDALAVSFLLMVSGGCACQKVRF